MKTKVPHLHEKRGWFYYVKKINGKMKWIALGTQDYTLALQKWAIFEGMGDNLPALPQKHTAMTFAECVLSYLPSIQGKVAENTMRAYNDRLRDDSGLMATFGSILLQNITRGDIITYHNSLSSTPYEANFQVRLLHAVMQYAVDKEMLAVNPAFKVKKFKERRHELKLTESILFEAIYPAAGPMLKRAIMLAFHLGGQHEQEVKTLTWANFDLEGCVCKIRRRKTGEVITVDYTENKDFNLFMNEIRAERNNLYPNIVHQEGGIPYQTFRYDWTRALKSAGLPELSHQFKEIRHLANTLMNAAGIPVYERMKMTGHKSIAVNERYTHDTGNQTIKAGAVLGKYGRR